MSKIRKVLFVRISAITTITLLLILVVTSKALFNSANGQTSSPCDNGTITGSSHVLPVILIHGYHVGSWVWSEWERLLGPNHIPFCTISFHQSDDACGRASDHAMELGQIIQEVKTMTGQNQVNIVGHSKGGLDARVYLANSGTHDVANLIMIGTPNGGGPLASPSDPCVAAIDFVDHADATQAPPNPHTRYYTITGDWNPYLFALNCPQQWSATFLSMMGPPFTFGFESEGYEALILMGKGPNDGIVPVSSVESLPNSTELGPTSDCHTNLLSEQEYNIAKENVLMP